MQVRHTLRHKNLPFNVHLECCLVFALHVAVLPQGSLCDVEESALPSTWCTNGMDYDSSYNEQVHFVQRRCFCHPAWTHPGNHCPTQRPLISVSPGERLVILVRAALVECSDPDNHTDHSNRIWLEKWEFEWMASSRRNGASATFGASPHKLTIHCADRHVTRFDLQLSPRWTKMRFPSFRSHRTPRTLLDSMCIYPPPEWAPRQQTLRDLLVHMRTEVEHDSDDSDYDSDDSDEELSQTMIDELKALEHSTTQADLPEPVLGEPTDDPHGIYEPEDTDFLWVNTLLPKAPLATRKRKLDKIE